MKLYLTPELLSHRRGRFLSGLLAIEPSPGGGLPESGMILMSGEQWQASAERQADYMVWARQPGCVLLLIPPYKEGIILPSLDWTVEFSSTLFTATGSDSLGDLLAQERVFKLLGRDGSIDEQSHIPYWKAHSNSGLVAATVLPLWSISLLNHADSVMNFLKGLYRLAGKTSAPVRKDETPDDALHPEDLTVMVCCYGYDVVTADSLAERLRRDPVPLLNLSSFDLPESFARLQRVSMLGEQGLTEAGLAFLQASKYWFFAEHLKGDARL